MEKPANSASARRKVRAQVSAAEFILEGLHAHKRIGRNEERVFTAGEKQPKQTRETVRARRETVSEPQAIQLAVSRRSSVVELER